MDVTDGGILATLAASVGALIASAAAFVRTRTTTAQQAETDARTRDIVRQETEPLRTYIERQKIRDEWLQESMDAIKSDIRDMLPAVVKEAVRSTADAIHGRRSD